MRLIHLTDPHLTSLDGWRPGPAAGKRWLSWLSWKRKRRNHHRRSRLQALVDALHGEAPDAWAVTGDLCHLGLARETSEAAGWLETLDDPGRILVVPGNHDVFAHDSERHVRRDWAAWLHRPEEDDRQRVVLKRFGHVALIGLDSAIVTPITRATGRLGQAALGRVDEALHRSRGLCRIVLIHHPPLPGSCKPRKALLDAPALKRRLVRNGAAMVLHGHLHHNRMMRLETNSGELRVFCTASASAADGDHPAAARVFDVQRADDGFSISMRVVALDAQDRARTIESEEWFSRG